MGDVDRADQNNVVTYRTTTNVHHTTRTKKRCWLILVYTLDLMLKNALLLFCKTPSYQWQLLHSGETLSVIVIVIVVYIQTSEALFESQAQGTS